MSGKFASFLKGLTKTRNNLFSSLFSSENAINEEFYEELEESMILADVGVQTTQNLLKELRDLVKTEKIRSRDDARSALAERVSEMLRSDSAFGPDSGPAVILVVGVNGVGKTTSVGKLAHLYKNEGRRPIIAAADTFRAAASEQLQIWAERADVPIVKHGEGADPGAVVYDAISAYQARKMDLLIVDTAGRLHNKANLMNELAKIQRIIARGLSDVPCEILLTLDATTGQNAVSQVIAFSEIINVSGLIITKLDGTAKGGIAVSLSNDAHVPVRFVGLGEGIEDFQRFEAEDYAKALF